MESDNAGIPEKRSRWKTPALMIGGALHAFIMGYSTLFFGFVISYEVLRMDNSTVWFALSVFVPFVGWAGLLGFLAFRLRRHAVYPFLAGGVIGVMLFLLVIGVCAARDLRFR
jgi:hypothetical protein